MRQKRPDKRKVQGAETKKKLYEIAERLFTERSYSEVSVEDITDEAGITKGAFYVHFESKDVLIARLIADHASRADAGYRTFMEAFPTDLPADEMLLALSEKIADVITNTIGCENMTKVYQMLLAGTVDTESVKGYNRELYVLFQKILERGLGRGELQSSLSADILARHFVMAMRGVTYEWCVRSPDFDLKKQAREHCMLLLRGITASAGTK